MSTSNGRTRGQSYPCASLDEALRELRRPPAPAAVKFKLQAVSKDGSSGQVACYIDARLVLDRLDLVCGAKWRASFEARPQALVPVVKEKEGERILYARCRLTVFGVTREDVGEGDTPKAAFSDALKRAAVHFGVGRALYAIASPWLEKGPGAGQLRTTRWEVCGSIGAPRRTFAAATRCGCRTRAWRCSMSRSTMARRPGRPASRRSPSQGPAERKGSRRGGPGCAARRARAGVGQGGREGG